MYIYIHIYIHIHLIYIYIYIHVHIYIQALQALLTDADMNVQLHPRATSSISETRTIFGLTRLLRNIRPPSDPPCACHTHTPYNIGHGNIV